MIKFYSILFYGLLSSYYVTAQYRNCAIWGYPKMIQGFSTSYGMLFLEIKKNESKIFLPGNNVQLDYSTSFWDVTSVFNVDLDIGFSYNSIDLIEVNGMKYNTVSINILPSISYKPCILNQYFSLTAFPTTYEYTFAEFNGNKNDLFKTNLAYGIRLSVNKSIYKPYQNSRYFVINYWQVFLSSFHDYSGNYIKTDEVSNFSGEIKKMNKVKFGLRIIFDGYKH